ncbi:type II secretion system protein GspJ [Halodesulfovibrio aestuarii]|uniref:Type II secretion system protein J n=1 Tax=Halodesulfovibrio aestuarii TaxID=126333 RepID=A0ABV4JWX5_9BACT
MLPLKSFSKNRAATQVHRSDRQAGFTLLELLIAMALMATIITTLFALFSNVLDASQHARKRMVYDQAGRTVLSIVEDDLRYMLPDMKTDGLQFDATLESEGFAERNLLGFATTSSLAFHANDHVRTLQYVTYILKEQDNDLYTLIRTEHSNPTVTGDFTDLKYPLLEDIIKCSFEYYDSEYNEFIKDWGVEKNTLPTAIRVNLVLGNKDEKYQYKLTVPLPQEENK